MRAMARGADRWAQRAAVELAAGSATPGYGASRSPTRRGGGSSEAPSGTSYSGNHSGAIDSSKLRKVEHEKVGVVVPQAAGLGAGLLLGAGVARGGEAQLVVGQAAQVELIIPDLAVLLGGERCPWTASGRDSSCRPT